jgi:hypothetical protein
MIIKVKITDEQKNRLNFLCDYTKKNRDHFLTKIIEQGIKDMEEQNIPSDILKTRINTQDKEDHAKPANAPHQKEKHAQNMQNTKKIRENQEADWGKYSQETMKENLIRASIFITIFEYFKNVIIQNLREVYTDFGLPRAEYDQNKITKTSHKFNEETFNSKDFKKDISPISSKSSIISIKEKYYDNKPLSDTSPNLKNTLLWLLDAEAITPEDIEIVRHSEAQRNLIAHELPSILTQKNKSIDMNLLEKLIKVLEKADKWHVANYDAAIIYPKIDFTNKINDITPGSIIFISILINVIMGEIDLSSKGGTS